jgi:glycosyltransferase involved in cell wall biosynthesis
MIKDFNIEEDVIIKGFIEYEKIPEALHNADIFVLSSLYESQNMSILEAAFCGLPVVSTDVGIAKEISDYIVPLGDYEALADKILHVINNPVTNYSDLYEKFSLEKCAEGFYQLYLSFSK